MHHANPSEYTLATVRDTDALLPRDPPPRSPARRLLAAALRIAALFLAAALLLAATLALALPALDPPDRVLLHVPRSFDDLKALNGLLKKYRDIYPGRVLVCYVTTYLFIQAFSLPGSMYLAILGGAVWGVPVALPLACTCVATGATLCYLISAAFGPALLTFPSWKTRLDTWSDKLRQQRDNLVSFLIILRIAPLPPHWVINIVCPHVGIGLVPFWATTFLGVFGVTVIHTSIGSGLDEMTSAADFNLVSWKNFLLLSAVVVGVLIPVALRYYFKREVASVAGMQADPLQDPLQDDDDDDVLAVGPLPLAKNDAFKGRIFYRDDPVEQDADMDDVDNDDDIILEAGPAIVIKSTPDGSSSGSASL